MTKKLLFSAVIFTCAVGALTACEPTSKSDSDSQDCNRQLCNTPFDALIFNGGGMLLIRLSEHGRFYRVNGTTADDIIGRFSYVPDATGADSTSYSGHLDGRFEWSRGMQVPVVFIRNIDDMHRLSPEENEQLLQEFEHN